MNVKSSISLTCRQDAFARDLVEQGRYPSLSAVLRDGLDLLRRKTEAEATVLRTLLSERQGGPFASGEEMRGRLADMIERKRRGRGVDRRAWNGISN